VSCTSIDWNFRTRLQFMPAGVDELITASTDLVRRTACYRRSEIANRRISSTTAIATVGSTRFVRRRARRLR
jgi:hypothetical protein